jgi:pimeloyl-ACP methyl ester carboxylesterase
MRMTGNPARSPHGLIGTRRVYLLVALAGAILASALPRAVMAAQEFLPNGTVNLAYWRLHSAASEYLVVIVHGGPGIAHNYLRPELDSYVRWGEVVYYDQRGCGRTVGVGTWEDHVNDLQRVITALRGRRKVVLVGSSWGAALIQLYLHSHEGEVTGVILSGLSSGRHAPEEVRQRLSMCAQANHATIESLQRSPPGNVVTTRTFRLFFEDSGPNGPSVPAVREDAFRWLRVTLPSHDPWFTHRDHYFAAVERFFAAVAAKR